MNRLYVEKRLLESYSLAQNCLSDSIQHFPHDENEKYAFMEMFQCLADFPRYENSPHFDFFGFEGGDDAGEVLFGFSFFEQISYDLLNIADGLGTYMLQTSIKFRKLNSRCGIEWIGKGSYLTWSPNFDADMPTYESYIGACKKLPIYRKLKNFVFESLSVEVRFMNTNTIAEVINGKVVWLESDSLEESTTE